MRAESRPTSFTGSGELPRAPQLSGTMAKVALSRGVASSRASASSNRP